MRAFKRWCCSNVIIPGFILMDVGNGTEDPPIATCHLPGPSYPGVGFLDILEDHWLWILTITLAVVMAVGVVLGLHHMRWRRLLRQQLELGYIDEEQYRRLR